jgi:hypothetical protein
MNYVVCLKYGNKYSAEYVNKLYNSVKRNLTVPFEFVCITEDSTGINPNVVIKDLPITNGVTGWWYKPFVFDPNIDLKGTILFLDLDMIIFRNIDRLFSYKPGRFCIIRDFNRFVVRNFKKMNSSIFRLESGSMPRIYNDFIKSHNIITHRYPGDQDWIYANLKDTNDFEYWPDDWIQSYKWEMRGKPDFDLNPRGQRDFAVNGDPIIKDNTAIAVFHGDPNPHRCKDQWVIDNWK